MMKKAEKDQIKKVAAEQIETLTADIEGLEKAAKPVAPDNACGRLSRMDAINNKAIVESSLADKKVLLRGLESVSTRIDFDSFGMCRKCGNAIAFNRLMALPHTDCCISCA